MAAPGRKFSFSRMVLNAFPNFAREDANDVDLTPIQADNLVHHQLQTPSPRYLSELSFFAAGIVGSKPLSKQVYKSLVKYGHIVAAPEVPASASPPSVSQGGSSSSSSANGGPLKTVNTAKITKSFASQTAVISVHAQRRLVGMLFFWEEECMRGKLLDEEEREIRSALGTNRESVDLACALEAVALKKKMLPSQRAEGTANVAAGRGHELPSYE